ncbi:NAD(P)/FAD-dependent oxidoreductase [Granulicella arctica]|uniref:Putative NAD/FAD-binding protein n=1 Tax=Granulicella arctica TaxID=940613 RepID=A0A7Y9PF98_9BACT|nr:FAD-dependent oxidoreductase [Granulicella arctica]NYF78615.1 putative NAD/FAD-binding protein [Granulicella arctica]
MSTIAVIGSGISGMSVAWLLSRGGHQVWLYEREARLGGHTHTHAVETSKGIRPIDTGFIVHNDRTYPNLVRLLRQLGVERQKSNMSFGVRCDRTRTEYSSRGLRGFFADKKNLLRPSHYKLFREMVRFNRRSTELIERGEQLDMTLREYLQRENFSAALRDLYLYPMACSVWSTSMDRIDEFPAMTLLRFFYNHGFLTVNKHPQWYVVKGGSSRYIKPLTAPYSERVVLGAKISKVSAFDQGTTVHFADGATTHFDEVVFACHAPQALALIDNPTQEESNILGAMTTTPNRTVLHTDSRLLPRRKDARASWNYHRTTQTTAPTLTYDMNRLQSLDTAEKFCVTLNQVNAVRRESVVKDLQYAHPLYTMDAVRAQGQWAEISGRRHLHFCGAYWFYGFHEDGLNSAIRVAKSLGVEW